KRSRRSCAQEAARKPSRFFSPAPSSRGDNPMKDAMLTRRGLLTGAGCLAAACMMPNIRVAFAAAPVEERFIFVILRGAMDGLAAIPPYGDRAYKSARGGIALPSSAYIPLDNFFGAHKNLANFAKSFQQGEAAVIH